MHKNRKTNKWVSTWKYHFHLFISVQHGLSWSLREKIQLGVQKQSLKAAAFGTEMGKLLLLEGIGKDKKEEDRRSCSVKSLTASTHLLPVLVGKDCQRRLSEGRRNHKTIISPYVSHATKQSSEVFFLQCFFFFTPLSYSLFWNALIVFQAGSFHSVNTTCTILSFKAVNHRSWTHLLLKKLKKNLHLFPWKCAYDA